MLQSVVCPASQVGGGSQSGYYSNCVFEDCVRAHRMKRIGNTQKQKADPKTLPLETTCIDKNYKYGIQF